MLLKERHLAAGVGGGEGGRGVARSYDGEKAWSSINNSIPTLCAEALSFHMQLLYLIFYNVEAQFKLFSSYVFYWGASETLNLCFVRGENPPVG